MHLGDVVPRHCVKEELDEHVHPPSIPRQPLCQVFDEGMVALTNAGRVDIPVVPQPPKAHYPHGCNKEVGLVNLCMLTSSNTPCKRNEEMNAYACLQDKMCS